MEEEFYVSSVFDAAGEEHAPAEATKGQRLVNFLVDGVVCLALYYPVGFLVSAALSRFGADLFVAVEDPREAWLGALILLSIIAAGYYTVMEAATGGRSIGKLLTGTIAVREDAQPFAARDAWMRSICRLIPFEPFSAIAGRPLHDRLSKTQVVQRIKRALQQETLLLDSSNTYDIRP